MPSKKKPVPGARRAPRKEPPITFDEITFCHLVLKGTGNPHATQLQRIEHAGAQVGFDAAMSSRIYHRKPIQKFLDDSREKTMLEFAREEVRTMKRKGFSREDTLTILYELATIPPERTKGSILGQVGAVAEMNRVMGIAVPVKDPDGFFKNRTEEEMRNFAIYGSFTAPVKM